MVHQLSGDLSGCSHGSKIEDGTQPFSKMCVDLTAQVQYTTLYMSESVSNVLTLTGGEEVKEAAKFVALMETFLLT